MDSANPASDIAADSVVASSVAFSAESAVDASSTSPASATKDGRAPVRRRSTWRRLVFLYVVVPYVSVVLIFAVLQRQLLYRGTRSERLDVSLATFAATGSRNVSLVVGQDITVRGWLLKTSVIRQTPTPLVVYFPGNASNRGERTTDLHEFVACGVDVLVFDYRGFGDSDGTPSETNLTQDAAAIWQFARTLPDYRDAPMIVYGESLGGAVAVSLWSGDQRPQPDLVILNSTFTSIPDLVAELYPWFPFRYLVVDTWRSLDRIGRIPCPVFVFHGTNDQIVPFALGEQLSAAGRLVEFERVPGGTHNEMPAGRLRVLLQESGPSKRAF